MAANCDNSPKQNFVYPLKIQELALGLQDVELGNKSTFSVDPEILKMPDILDRIITNRNNGKLINTIKS